jgi:hypothetical protein
MKNKAKKFIMAAILTVFALVFALVIFILGDLDEFKE